MNFRTVQVFSNPLLSDRPQLLVAELGRDVDPDEAAAFKEMRIGDGSVFYTTENDGCECFAHYACCHGGWKGGDDAYARLPRLLWLRGPCLLDGTLNRGSAQCDVD